MELCVKEQCTGCLSCFNICPKKAITISIDVEGFLRPNIEHDKCISCGLCEKACPILNEPQRDRVALKLYGAWNKDNNLLKNSSSGGIFTTIATQIINEGGLVFGAAYDEDFNVRHICVETHEELSKLRGSKYVQSTIGDTYREVLDALKKGRKVFFTGTPCQVAGLYGFLGKRHYDMLFTADFLCHGTPSSKVFQAYKEWLEAKHNSKMVAYNYRSKHWGWNGWCLQADFENGEVYYGKNNEDPYFQAFIREFVMRPCCYNCHYVGTKRFADITMGDFWGYKTQKGEEDNHNKGVSIVITNTRAGEQMFDIIQDKLFSYRRTVDDAKKINWTLYTAFAANEKRPEFWHDYEAKGWQYLVDSYLKPKPLNPVQKLQYAFGFDNPILKGSIKLAINMKRLIRKIVKR